MRVFQFFVQKMLPPVEKIATKWSEQTFFQTMKNILSISFLSLLSAGSLFSQDVAYYDSTKANVPGYWEVSTDYRTNGTAIRYFNPDKQLMHQEVLPNKMVKLTKKNVRRLNATLTKVSLKQPETSNVKTVDLPIDNEDLRVVRERKRMMDAERRASSVGLMARIVATSDGSDAFLKMFIYNPHEEKLRIEIVNGSGHTVCQEYDRMFQHYYKFNMSTMPSGDYRVQIFKISERKPAITNQVTLSRKPSQTFITTQEETPKETNTNPYVSQK
jgi:hypothetical protein